MKSVQIGDHFLPAFKASNRFLVLCGGGGSGKTEFVARKLLLRAETEGNHRFLNLRKVRSRVKESIQEVVIRMLRDAGKRYLINRTDRTIITANRQGVRTEWLFDGLDDPDKIKSIKGITGVWMEEATEFTDKDFLQLDLRLREPTPFYKQIILSFNPDQEKAPWIKKIFFDHIHPDAFIDRSTIEDNPIAIVRDEYTKRLDQLREQDETYYQIYRLGEWAIAKGKIFNWNVEPLPVLNFDEIFYGGDYGYSVDPAVVVRISRKADDFWIQELIYERGLTNAMLAAKMKDAGIKPREPIYFDSSEPKSTQEIFECGFNAKPSAKGPDTVRAGIDFLKSKRIHIVEGSENLIREANAYKWREDKNGNLIPEPVKFNDHSIDATRYGIFTHCFRRPRGAAAIVKRSVYPE